MFGKIALCGWMLMAGGATMQAQAGVPTTPPPTTTPEVINLDALAQQGKALLEKARATPSGSAGITLASYKNSYTMLTARVKSGGAEQHGKFADFLIIVDGEGTELTGGTFVNRKDGQNGDATGTALEGATAHPLHKGDVIHIPAGTPHQSIQGPGQTLTVYVVKVDESATPVAPAPMAVTK